MVELKEVEIEKIIKQGEKKVSTNSLLEDIGEVKERVFSLLLKRERRTATEEIVNFIREVAYIYTTKDDLKSEIWIYNNGVYTPQGRSFIKELCRKILLEAYTTSLANEVIAKIEADTFIEPDAFFSINYPNEVPVQNGILNILTREVKPFSPQKIFFSKLPVRYDKDSKCEKIDKFLSEVLSSSEDKEVLYEIAGFGLLKDYRFEKAVMMVGGGRNGKGKTIELMKRLVGVENCAGIPLQTLTTQPFSISELFGKFFNLAGDLSSSDLKNTAIFKSLTGRDQISAPRKFLKDVIFTNYAKMVFACNELPKVYDTSLGFWDRWLLFEFPYTFVTQDVYDMTTDKSNLKIKDENIIEKISTDEELSGFLNMALDGLNRLLENHDFSYSKGTEEVKNSWIRKADSFMAFCMDMIEEDPENKISKKALRKKFNEYCKKHKIKGAGDKAIKATLQEMFGVIDEYVSTGNVGNFDYHSENKQEFVWSGIKWKITHKKGGI